MSVTLGLPSFPHPQFTLLAMGTHRLYGNVKPLPLPVITEEWKDPLSKYFICMSETGLRSVWLFSMVLLFYYHTGHSIDLQLSVCLSIYSICLSTISACLSIFLSSCHSATHSSAAICLSTLSVCLFVCLSIYSVCMTVRLSVSL